MRFPVRLRDAAALLLALLAPACSLDPATSYSDGFVRVAGGDSLYYRLYGLGPDTLVALHGGPALSSAYLEAALAPLARKHAVLFYDQRGRGRSSAVRPDSLSYAQDLSDLEEVRAHFGMDSVTLIGHHWGAGLAFGYTLRHPDHVRRLLLLAPIAHEARFIYQLALAANDTAARARWMKAREQHADSLEPEEFCRQFWGFGFSPSEVTAPAIVRQLAPEMCEGTVERLRHRGTAQLQLMGSLGNWSWRDSLRQVSRPSLVIVGTDSPALAASARLWARQIPGARSIFVGQMALFPWLEAREEFARTVEQFLSGGWPQGAVRPDSVGNVSVTTPASSGT
jgi:proline iminopeptidase